MDDLSAPEVKVTTGFSFSCTGDMPHYVFQSITAKNRTKCTSATRITLRIIHVAGVQSTELQFSQVIPSVSGMDADVHTVEEHSPSPQPLFTATLLPPLCNKRVTKPTLENMSLLII